MQTFFAKICMNSWKMFTNIQQCFLPSERLSGTQAVGDRLKEGVSINQSLSCLGNCIHALAERSSGKSVRGENFDLI